MNLESQSGIGAGKLRSAEWGLIAVVIGASLLFRFATLSGPLDEPSWRQVWSAFQAKTLAAESPPDVMHVKMNFRGRDWVAVANFPFYEIMVAGFYKLIGSENLAMARLITLFFFCAGAYYLFRVVALWFGPRVGWYSLAAYSILPFSLFYSRAVHYDVPVIALGHASLYYGIRFFRDRKVWLYLAAVAVTTVGFLIKPPYLFYFGLPLLVFLLLERKNLWLDFLLLGLLYVLPLAAGLWFEAHRVSTEANKVSGLLYEVLHSAAHARKWYFGGVAERLDSARWGVLLRRVYWLVLTPFGVFAATWAALTTFDRARWKGWACFAAWCAGAAAYVMLIFPMAASPHDYYVLPLVAPAAVLLGLFLDSLARSGETAWRGVPRCALALGVLVLMSARSLQAHGYFTRDWQKILAGRIVAQETSPDDLIVCSAVGRSTARVDPRTLYFCDRIGWANTFDQLTEENLATYASAGARYAVVIVTPDFRAEAWDDQPVSRFPSRVLPVRGDSGKDYGEVRLFDLQAAE